MSQWAGLPPHAGIIELKGIIGIVLAAQSEDGGHAPQGKEEDRLEEIPPIIDHMIGVIESLMAEEMIVLEKIEMARGEVALGTAVDVMATLVMMISRQNHTRICK